MKTITTPKRQISYDSDQGLLDDLKYILPRLEPGETISIFHGIPETDAAPKLITEAPKEEKLWDPILGLETEKEEPQVETKLLTTAEEQPKTTKKRRRAKSKTT